MTIPFEELEYANVAGDAALRQNIADYYNHLYRQDKESQYKAANICVVPGGRAGLTRVMATLGHLQVGYFVPDYTAYEQCLSLFQRINPTQYVHRDLNQAVMPADEFEFQTVGRGVGAVLMSNPSNPTGQSVEGECLKEYDESGETMAPS
jgi:aspartate/methionine/tyrosine aminotransferase